MNCPTITVLTVGYEQELVAVIDDFAPDPDYLRAHAADATFVSSDLYYPGIKAALPQDYFRSVQSTIAAVMHDIFRFAKGADVLRASYSITTTPRHLLSLEQRMPHIDALDSGRMAILHYLSLDDIAGTMFFRHRSTGYETLNEARSADYFDSLNADLRKHGIPPAAFICSDTPIFEQTGHVDGRFNRALIYRGCVLHSGAIGSDHKLSADPRSGRLTIASFLAAQ